MDDRKKGRRRKRSERCEELMSFALDRIEEIESGEGQPSDEAGGNRFERRWGVDIGRGITVFGLGGSRKRRGKIRPENAEEAVSWLLEDLSEGEKETLRTTPENQLMLFHHGFGTYIRNEMIRGGHKLRKSMAERWGRFVQDDDDASGVLIKAVWNRLNGHPVDYHTKPEFDVYVCDACGGEARVPRWAEDDLVPPERPLCNECAWEAADGDAEEQE